MSDLDSEIVAALVSALSEREVSCRLGCAMGRVRAALDERMSPALMPAEAR
jgi:hypothetical protein